MVWRAVAGGATGRGLQVKVKFLFHNFFFLRYQSLILIAWYVPGLGAWRFTGGGGQGGG